MKQTPEQRAEARWVRVGMDTDPIMFRENVLGIARIVHATCIREEVEPMEAAVERLRALVQELAIALERCVNENGEVWGGELSLIAAAKEQGFVPTNTEDK